MLRDFIGRHREVILARASLRVAERNAPVAEEGEPTHGLSAFLEQLRESLRRTSGQERIDHSEIERSASDHGDALFHQGATVGQVVHDYGDLCQVITGLAVEQQAPIAIEEFQMLNLCLDDAIAGAVAAFAQKRERAISEEGIERLGVLAHEMRNLVGAAMISFANIKKGIVGPGGSTSAIHDRALVRLNTLIDRSLASVRLDAGLQTLEVIQLSDVIEEVEIGASIMAQGRGLRFAVESLDRSLTVEADRQILAAAIANLLQNAFKFTRAGTLVKLTASATASRVLIAIEDRCGGLPAGGAASLVRPFVRRGADRSGLGLGLLICLKAVKAFGGELHIDDMPDKGCVFTIDLPRRWSSDRPMRASARMPPS